MGKSIYTSSRLWLMIWGTLGLLLLLYVTIAALVKPSHERSVQNTNNNSAINGKNPTLASGPFLIDEMADFTLAFPPREAPQIPFQYKDKDLTLDDFKGKTILVNFWATWCAPCLKELPSLDRLQGALGGDKFEIIAIAADPRGPEIAQKFLNNLDISHLSLYSDRRLLFASAIGGANILPVSILYDPRGNEVGRLIGEANWDSSSAKNLIKGVIEGQAIKR